MTPSYMSPEQLRSARSVDTRTDIWALGVILYELLSTRLPFPGEAMAEVMAAVFRDAPLPLSEVRPDLPAELCEIVRKCLAKDPDERFQSIASLAHALERVARASSLPAQRILAVARESSARAAGITPLPGEDHASSRGVDDSIANAATEAAPDRRTSETRRAAAQQSGATQRRRRLLWPTITVTVVTLGTVALYRLEGRAQRPQSGTPRISASALPTATPTPSDGELVAPADSAAGPSQSTWDGGATRTIGRTQLPTPTRGTSSPRRRPQDAGPLDRW
jgi:serine/threonine-protein kinase